MANKPILKEVLRDRGVSRRGFMRYCATLTSMMALPAAMIPKVAQALEGAPRPSVIWLSFQECTGCTESITRSHSPTLEDLIFNAISLDYHHTLQAASGHAAEAAREAAMKAQEGKYLLVVDGSIPLGNPGFSTIAGISNEDMLRHAAKGAAAVIAVGTCAAYGGLPMADPNPTGAVPVSQIVTDKPVINIPGCPPIGAVMTGVLAHFLTFQKLPKLDELGRPVVFYGDTIHDRCYRRPFYNQGLFADGFDDEGARKGWCLFKVGCKGPVTRNACATIKWNGGVSFPIQSGHGCIGCSQPDFWDAGSLYSAVASPTADISPVAGVAVAAGIGVGVAAVALNSQAKKKAAAKSTPVTVQELGDKK